MTPHPSSGPPGGTQHRKSISTTCRDLANGLHAGLSNPVRPHTTRSRSFCLSQGKEYMFPPNTPGTHRFRSNSPVYGGATVVALQHKRTQPAKLTAVVRLQSSTKIHRPRHPESVNRHLARYPQRSSSQLTGRWSASTDFRLTSYTSQKYLRRDIR